MGFDHKACLKGLSAEPGVYQMLNQSGQVIYVGKAKHLKRRLSSYFRSSAHIDAKTTALVAEIADIKVIITTSENEALILENNLIKRFQPRFNILLKDNKTYPELLISGDPYPRMSLHRGPHRTKGRYFGPYPNVQSVKETLVLLQKIFRLRQCSNTFFKQRTRPCLQFQIRRCSAPCVGRIDAQRYADAVQHSIAFLKGESHEVIHKLIARMQAASKQQRYELAAELRDQIAQLRDLQRPQAVQVESGDVDVVTMLSEGERRLAALLIIRDGRVLGQQHFLLHVGGDWSDPLWAFMQQYYLHYPLADAKPTTIYTTTRLKDAAWLESVLRQQWDRPVRIRWARQGQAKQWAVMAVRNAAQALASEVAQGNRWKRALDALGVNLGLQESPERVVCFDVSHHAGEATRVSCVACDQNGLAKQDYRLFKVEGISKGDDYGALADAVMQYLEHVTIYPDVMLIDGGAGQLKAVIKALDRHGGVESIHCIGIAKGASRKRGAERFWLGNPPQAWLPDSSSVMVHVMLHLRDEAHRFALKAHRSKKHQSRRVSVLEGIPGVGILKRRALLHHFGGMQGLRRATVDQLIQVDGIHLTLAERIHTALSNKS